MVFASSDVSNTRPAGWVQCNVPFFFQSVIEKWWLKISRFQWKREIFLSHATPESICVLRPTEESIESNFVFLGFQFFDVKLECLLHMEKINWQ